MDDMRAVKASESTTLDQRGCKRPLTEDQRKAKNDRDRERRQEYKLEFKRLQHVELQYKELQIEVETLREENQRLENALLEIEELDNALLERAAPDKKYPIRKKKLRLQPGGEINQTIWNTTTVWPWPHLPLMPDLSVSAAAVQTQVNAATAAEESVIDKETVTNEFAMRVPFLFVASKTEKVSCIRLRGKCSASPEGGSLQYSFEWIPQQTDQESWGNLEIWDLIQNLATPQYTRVNAQPNSPIKFMIWNSIGALNAKRQRVVMELINRFQPAVLVLTETRLSRARAEEIIDAFPFDAHRVTPNLGYVGGMWLLWRAGVVEVDVLSFTEQEIHALIKEPQTNQNAYPSELFRDMNFDFLEETRSFVLPYPNEPVANSVPVAEAQGNAPQMGSSKRYADEPVEIFIKTLDAKEKDEVDFSDFKGLKEELETSGLHDIPPSLAPIHGRIKMVYGDITAGSQVSPFIVRACYIVFCSVIKEMDELKLEDVDEKKMLFWRDAINSGLSNGLRGNFAIDHLKNIARAYYGLKAWNNRGNDQIDMESMKQRMSELKIELCSLEAEHAKKLEEQASEVRKQCLHVAEQFSGKPLSTYLFPTLSSCID